MVRETFQEGPILMKNEKNLASTMVGQISPVKRNSRAKSLPRTGMPGCTWGSQRRDGEEVRKGVRPSFSVVNAMVRRMDFILGKWATIVLL